MNHSLSENLMNHSDSVVKCL